MILQHPCPGGTLNDGFGPRDPITTAGGTSGSFHYAQDWAAPAYTPILAAAAGRVIVAGRVGTYGIAVYIDHGSNVVTRSAHMVASPPVGVGWYVEAGQIIGYVGMTGAATGNHLHFEVVIDGTRVDPLPLIHAALPALTKEDDSMEPDSMFAVVDGVPSWCFLNWANGRVVAFHTQAEADWAGTYMGSVKFNWAGDPYGGERYKSKLALFGMLAPKIEIQRGGLSDEEFARLEAMITAGVKAALESTEA